ncbi:MAG: CusA/CzcA family heavy metal efflux RND transporter, partial [Chitinophagaceae bacterium]|nr:CusA/CzcA family heavy metal efflux RND transporter [Chitinophagaceae bacterium]
KLIIGLMTLALIAWGGYSLTRLSIDAVPDITNNQVQVITSAPSQAASDIERLVTFPIEQSVATIPGLSEVRSFSRFGLSVITIVFDEDVDVYWARQQVSERLNDVKGEIPSYIGSPKMAPVTTGLGEIYQYVLRPEKGYEDKYSISDLRTIQDWIVRRRLLGVEGVAEISSFGGHLKQYEVAVNPAKLRGMNVSISEVIAALETNNKNTGGAYIDSKPSTYFIRTEGLTETIDDIEKIVVKVNPGGLPILVRDVGVVQEGSAVRYGAMTYNGKGEAVGGIVMMLKGANSSDVINKVTERVQEVRKNLPEGVEIVPYLDRTKLVNNAISTVSRNLIEGALIVIFVLVLLLGNLRAGLIVASVIPLAMLFAFSLMNLFGVSGNLMSLGALDFGLIVDGAVIIVEATMHHLSKITGQHKLSRDEMDKEVLGSAGKMLNSAAFGQIIILIVYLPILVLTGIEGKMFRPMAQTVSFAIMGAFILSLTYVPMMSALFLSRKTEAKTTFSDRLIHKLQSWYEPLLAKALHHKRMVVLAAFLLFAGAGVLFAGMGAEFLPSLDEGDYAVEMRLLPGTSLPETAEVTMKASRILLKEFPDEVVEVVGKIGSSEVPTDPMPIEAADLIIVLKDKDQWKKASTKDELTEKMSAALEKLPIATFGFQQPIQMRFNELMTGAKQDVVVKIYGDDLDKLTEYAGKVSKITTGITGARDIYEEQVTGLTQVVIDYDRAAIARHGLSVDEINKTVNAAFAGYVTGKVYEGERRFDMVVRLEEQVRGSIEDVRKLIVTTADGRSVPLEQLADVSFRVGPNQIQRDDTKRRIIVGFNVRDRDVASVVKELQQKVIQQIHFDPGYHVTYGGTFENLQKAKARLSIAVPVALLLIFILLYFAFGSIKQGLMIYTAIPLSAIGGILALWTRGMPFSISAAVGFIALFGVAVLNGIVLIAEFNRLKKDLDTDLKDIILKGTHSRLRPVIMTALVASLGFLPMALSHGSGAEVQKPLATVVIGGLITATMLTLFVLPCLYYLVEQFSNKRHKGVSAAILLLLVAMPFAKANAQRLTPNQAVNIALENNYGLKASVADVTYNKQMKRAAWEMPKTQVSAVYGQYNSYISSDNNYTISQQIPFPTLFIAKTQLAKEKEIGAQLQKDVVENDLVYKVKEGYYNLLYLQEVHRVLQRMDSLYTDFSQAAELRYKTGEGTLLEQSTAQARKADVKNRLLQNLSDITIAKRHLQALMSTDDSIEIADEQLLPLVIVGADLKDASANPVLKMMEQDAIVSKKQKAVEMHAILPDLMVGYFNQTMVGNPLNDNSPPALATSTDRFTGVQFGVSIPLFVGPQMAKMKAQEANRQKALLQYRNTEIMLNSMYEESIQEYVKQKNSLAYYNETGLANMALIRTQAQKSYNAGEVSYTEYLVSLQQVQEMEQQYLKTISDHNRAVLRLAYLSGGQLQIK